MPFTIIRAFAAPDDADGEALIVADGDIMEAPLVLSEDVLLAVGLIDPVSVARGAVVPVVSAWVTSLLMMFACSLKALT